MNSKTKTTLWQIIGFIFTSLLGVLLHFLHDWTNNSKIVALFSSVNESTWEHIKILFVPLFVFAIIQSRYFKEYKSFWCVKLVGTVMGMLLIPILFYTLNGAFGKTPDWVNIGIYFVSAAAVFFTEYVLFKRESLNCRYSKLSLLGLCLIAVIYIYFTFCPPELPLFIDPVTQTYGAQ